MGLCTQINRVNKLLPWGIVIVLNSLRGISYFIFCDDIPISSVKYRKPRIQLSLEFYV